jgi:hypothetical protein
LTSVLLENLTASQRKAVKGSIRIDKEKKRSKNKGRIREDINILAMSSELINILLNSLAGSNTRLSKHFFVLLSNVSTPLGVTDIIAGVGDTLGVCAGGVGMARAWGVTGGALGTGTDSSQSKSVPPLSMSTLVSGWARGIFSRAIAVSYFPLLPANQEWDVVGEV